MNEHPTEPLPAPPAAEALDAPRPAREAQRLQQLAALDVFGTPPENFADAVVAAAASIANTPISAISLVGSERLWLKAAIGLDAREIDRRVAFCAHTVAANAPLLVADASQDARFAASPLVVGPPFARFYAGFPIVVGGEPVGALCVIDDLARRIDAVQVERLRQLADGVAAWLSERARARRGRR